MDRLAALEIFVRVVDTGSFSAAARHQRIGQPAVSKAVVQLEKWLGVSLLMRSTRSVVPTEAGRIFYERAKRTIEEADEAVVAARGSASGLSGKLRVSTSVCLGRLHVIPNLPAFLAEHPALDIDLVLDDRNVDLVNEGIDVALRVGAMPDFEHDCAPDRGRPQHRCGDSGVSSALGNPDVPQRSEQPSGDHLHPGQRR